MAKEKKKLNEVVTAFEKTKDEIAKMKLAEEERLGKSKRQACDRPPGIDYVQKLIKTETN